MSLRWKLSTWHVLEFDSTQSVLATELTRPTTSNSNASQPPARSTDNLDLARGYHCMRSFLYYYWYILRGNHRIIVNHSHVLETHYLQGTGFMWNIVAQYYKFNIKHNRGNMQNLFITIFQQSQKHHTAYINGITIATICKNSNSLFNRRC